MTHQKAMLRLVLLGTAVLTPLFSQIEISSGQEQYTVTALLRVEPPQTPKNTNVLSSEMMNRRVQNYMQTILSEKTLQKAIQPEKSDNNASDWRKEISQKHPDTIEYLKHTVHVRQLPGTDLIAISLTGEDRIAISEIVNSIAEAAVEDAKKDAGEKCSEQINILSFESKEPKTKKDILTKSLIQLDEEIYSLIPRKNLLMEQRVVLQAKVTTQLKLLAIQTRWKRLPEGNEKASLTGEVFVCEEQLAWCNRELEKNTDQLRRQNSLHQKREAVKKELEMLERDIHSFTKKFLYLRMRMRSEQPLHLYQPAVPPAQPDEKGKGRKGKTQA